VKTYLWIAGLALLAVAGLAVWFNFSDPKFVAGLISVAVAAIIPVLFKLKADYKAENEAYRRGQGWDHIKKKPKDLK
jgi:O-antigen ligase